METYYFGNNDAELVLVQPVDGHDLELMERECELIRSMTGREFLLAAVRVGDWNRGLSPWPAPAVFGREDFGGGAGRTLAHIEEELLPRLRAGKNGEKRRFAIGGYSLAGLFALFAAYRSNAFPLCAAVSPSVWFPGFIDFARENRIKADAVYLSLGDREERTRSPVMARVGGAIRELHSLLESNGTACTLEWNEGNHFRDSELRTAKGFAWLLNKETPAEPNDITSTSQLR